MLDGKFYFFEMYILKKKCLKFDQKGEGEKGEGGGYSYMNVG